jgi:hypothetical protein
MKRCLISNVSPSDVLLFPVLPTSASENRPGGPRLRNTPLGAVEMKFLCPAPSAGGEGQEKIQQPPEGSMGAHFGSKTTRI